MVDESLEFCVDHEGVDGFIVVLGHPCQLRQDVQGVDENGLGVICTH